MQGSIIEEHYFRCYRCASGLSYIEASLYGNKCVFCADTKKKINFFKDIIGIYYDYQIYKEILKMADRSGTEVGHISSDEKYRVQGELAYFGFQDISFVNTVPQKKAFLKALRRCRNG